MLNLRLLGGFAATFEEGPNLHFRSDKGRALLAYLAAEPNRPHSRESLATLLWGDYDTTTAKTYLRNELSNIRKLTHSHPAIEITRQTVEFKSDLADVDVAHFESTIGRFLTATAQDQVNLVAEAEGAINLYKDAFLAGFDVTNALEFSEWYSVKREQLHQFAMRGHDQVQEVLINSGQLESATLLAQKQLVLERWHEPAHRRLIHIYGMQSKRGQAIAQYEKLKDALQEELELEPEAQTVDLLEKIKAGEFEQSQTPQPAPVRSINKYKVLAHLEMMPDQKLFGVDEIITSLDSMIKSADRPWLIALDGLGGSGKTTLANALIHQILNNLESDFEDIAWISAKQEEFVTGRGIQPKIKSGALDADSLVDQLLFQLADGPWPTHSSMAKQIALTQIVKEKRCLIVVDNLETAADYLTLLPLLRQLAGPTKFLITSRITLHNESDVFCHSLGELAQKDVFEFLRYESRKQGLAALLSAETEQFHQIYETVGGNPLALKLIMGQLHYLPLNEVLATLRRSERQSVDQIYEYIYWQAWKMLSKNGRELLLTLPIYPNGTFDQIADASGLDRYSVRIELNHLRSLSLVQTNGDLAQPRYRIHRLTETFLMHEIIKWQAGTDNGKSPEEDLFGQKIEVGLSNWYGAFDTSDDQLEVLRREKEGVIKAIQLGLTIPEAWPMVKDLIEALTTYMERMGYWDEWLVLLNRGIVQAQQLEDLEGELMIAHYRGRILQRQSKPQEVIRNYARIIRLARRSGNDIAAARAASNLGFAYANKQQLLRATTLCHFALDIFKKHTHLNGQGHTNNHLGIIFRKRKDWDQAESYYFAALSIWEKVNNLSGKHVVLSNLGLLYADTENYLKATMQLQNALAIVKEVEDKKSEAVILNNLGFINLKRKNLQEALAHSTSAEAIFQEQASHESLFNVWDTIGQIYAAKGDASMASAYITASQEGIKNLRAGFWELPQIETYLT